MSRVRLTLIDVGNIKALEKSGLNRREISRVLGCDPNTLQERLGPKFPARHFAGRKHLKFSSQCSMDRIQMTIAIEAARDGCTYLIGQAVNGDYYSWPEYETRIRMPVMAKVGRHGTFHQIA
jgi:hypothetical protein